MFAAINIYKDQHFKTILIKIANNKIKVKCLIFFLTAEAVLGIAFTPRPPPPSKTDEKCCQKAELDFAKCNFQNSDTKYLAYGLHTKQLFLP